MPIFDCENKHCRHSVTKRENDRMFIDCPKCKTVVGMKRRVSLHGVKAMVDSKNMDPLTIQEHLQHKREIEADGGKTMEFKAKGPREFQPEMPRTIY